MSSGLPSPLGHGADPPLSQPRDVLDSVGAGRATIRGSGLLMVGYAGGTLLALVSVPLLVRHLGIAGYGRYVSVVSLVTIVGGVTDAGLAAVAIREHATTTGATRERLARALLGIRIVLTMLGVITVAAFAALAGYGAPLVLGTVLSGAGLTLLVVQQTWATVLRAELRLGWVTLAEFVRQFVSVAGIFALVVLGAEIAAFFAVAIPASFAALVITGARVRSTVSLRPSLDFAAWRNLLRETLPVSIAVALHSVYMRIVVVLMSLVSTDLQTGYFATSLKIVDVLFMVPFLLAQAILPVLVRAARDDEKRFAYGLQSAFEVALVGGAGATLLTVLGAPVAVSLLAGAEGAGAVDVLRVQALVVLMTCQTAIWQYALFALRCHRALAVANLAGLIVAVVATLVLAPVHGAVGAAVAAVLAELVLMAGSVLALSWLRPQLRPTPGNLPRVAVAAVAGLMAGILPDVADAVRLVLGGVTYIAVAFVLRAVPTQLAVALRPG